MGGIAYLSGLCFWWPCLWDTSSLVPRPPRYVRCACGQSSCLKAGKDRMVKISTGASGVTTELHKIKYYSCCVGSHNQYTARNPFRSLKIPRSINKYLLFFNSREALTNNEWLFDGAVTSSPPKVQSTTPKVPLQTHTFSNTTRLASGHQLYLSQVCSAFLAEYL